MEFIDQVKSEFMFKVHVIIIQLQGPQNSSFYRPQVTSHDQYFVNIHLYVSVMSGIHMLNGILIGFTHVCLKQIGLQKS